MLRDDSLDPTADPIQARRQALIAALGADPAAGVSPTISTEPGTTGAPQAGPSATTTPPTTTPAVTPAAPAASSTTSNLPPWLQEIYKSAGVTDGGAGAGFTDGSYWSDKQSQADRLKADLAGTGNDQPGPKDSGAALNSGKHAPPGWGGIGPAASAVPSLFSGSGVNTMLQSDPTTNINSALSNIGAMANGNGYLQQLIAALSGGH